MPIPGSSSVSVEIDGSLGDAEALKESGSKKRVRSESSSASSSKACREKLRRDRLNDKFLELGSILEPGRPPKTDKAALQEKIKELKAEKTELRDEKQRLKSEKEKPAHGNKMVPFIGYPGVAMWQFMPPAAVDTSQDHVLRPPVA
ncbi:hypothetical protein M0R45_002815 [Rubus argutus]|uniref:BHLH domain-containing protein n=1 Tax=Rubus argutus TaxID=59490 RepID=A0AAW1VRF5_RUBAR